MTLTSLAPPHAHRWMPAIATALCLAAAGCEGFLGDPASGRDGPATGPGPSGCGTTQAPERFLRRLTNAEYTLAVRDLLGVDPGVVAAVNLPGDTTRHGFDNNAEVQTISALHVDRYQLAAEQIAAGVLAAPGARDRYVGCDPRGAGREACVRDFAGRFGRRAFRRPLTGEEIDALAALARAAPPDDPDGGLGLVIQALLQSPSFLYLPEAGRADGPAGGMRWLDGYEMAARLSFALLGTTPSDALLDRAGRRELDTPEGVERAAREMLATPDARARTDRFVEQWLQLNALPSVVRDRAAFPTWSDALRASMAEETRRFVADLVWRDGADFRELVTARYTFVDSALASHYGLGPPGSPWARVDLPAASGRAGLLTHASILTVYSKSDAAAPVHRGRFVRAALLCQEPPPPPANVGELPAAQPGVSNRERLAIHRASPACATCHDRMDPIGFGLDGYDIVGARRTVDAAGQPIDTHGRIEGFPQPDFDGPFELGQRVHDAPEFASCVVTQLFRWTAARSVHAADDCALAGARAAFERSGYRVPDVIASIVRSDAFRSVPTP
jgi:hypothetical protein